MKNHNHSLNSSSGDERGKNTKKEYAKKLYSLLHKEPMSRRMAATQLGFADQTYMVTQIIFDWIKEGRAEVVGSIKCKRSNRFVEAITTNSELFRNG
ncbi:hypothetical protein GH721_16260 [Kriegella sp. EG-1]|nr:hypothetical protein [Flavobacteriaceae bacterium EG-1]